MFNFKISGIAAGAAFILSFLIGLFSGSGFLILLLRAFIFAVVFFGLSCLVFWLLAQFVPELLSGGGEDDLGFSLSGSRVDISVGDGPITGAFPSDGSESVDDIASRPPPPRSKSQGLDQEGNAGYNADGEVDGELEEIDDEPASGGRPGRSGSGDALPDIDGLAEDTSGSAVNAEDAEEISFDGPEPARRASSSRKSDMGGDFDPKELAKAIQTVLKRDDKG